MKKNIHPKYYPNAKVTCSCGASFEIGSTEPEIRVEVCSVCHPYYTGTQKYVDTAGRVDRFKTRLAKAKEIGKSINLKKNKKDIKVDEKPAIKKESKDGVANKIFL